MPLLLGLQLIRKSFGMERDGSGVTLTTINQLQKSGITHQSVEFHFSRRQA